MPAHREPERATPDPVWARRVRAMQVVAAAVVLTAAGVELVRMVLLGSPAGGYVALAAALLGCATGFRYPVVGLLLVAAAPLTATALGWDPLVTWTMAVFSAFVLTVRGLSGVLTGVVVGATNLVAAGLSHSTVGLADPGLAVQTASVACFAAVASAATGSAVLGQFRYVSELRGRTAAAVAARQAAVDRGVAQERVRIARDLHDGLGHRIAVVSMRLGTAEVHLPAGAEESRTDLHLARADLKAALLETQQILRVLRIDTPDGAPSPVHQAIPDLVGSFRDAGLDVEAALGDLTRPLAPQTSAAAFRIVQEVLTNARRHGTGAVSLRVGIGSGTVVIEAVNARSAGRAAGPGGTGFGLIGLRERAVSAGGHLEARSDGDLFRVRAVLPADDGTAR